MTGNGAAPERGAGRPVDKPGGISLFGRIWRGGQFLPDGAASGPVHPVLRLYARWVRRPLLPALRLWRRNIQLRVVASTLLMSLGVVLLLGVVVIGQVRNGLLEAKQRTAQGQARGGFTAARDMADSGIDARGQDSGQTATQSGRRTVDSGNWLTGLVEQLASSGQGVYSVVALSSNTDDTSSASNRGARSSGDVDPERSVPQDLREKVEHGTGVYEKPASIKRGPSDEGVPGLVVGKRLYDVNGKPYQLYYLFPFSQEAKSLSLVTTTLATAGVFVVVLLGAIAWLVVRQVVTPVRMAAGISERLAAGILQERMKVTGEDDIARLGESFNKMAQNLQGKIQQLEELSRMQRRFVSDVSHELRTPLTTVRMAAEVIHDARDEFDPVTARSAELLHEQLDRFESLLADLLEISRFDAGAAALEAEPIDLRDVVHRVIGGAEPLAERKGSRILVRGAEQPVIAEADARRVERVLRNLVVNAVEHGEGRDVVVRFAVAGGAVGVAVRDYGVGLKPGEATRVFNRFWRADPARARTTGGTGLGLSIAVEDARLHGGWLQAWGEPGGGSQFRLTLPRTAGDTLRGSPIPLEPADSRRNRGLAEAGGARGTNGALGAGAGASRGVRAVEAGVAAAGGGGVRASATATVNGAPGGGSLPLAGSVPVQPTDTRAGATAVRAPAADPTALPGSNGGRVVARKDAVGREDDAQAGAVGGGDRAVVGEDGVVGCEEGAAGEGPGAAEGGGASGGAGLGAAEGGAGRDVRGSADREDGSSGR
ncbi:MtrAB system histidine kinase MtrB [Streptomyces varsoviensis]|nr:MtrAB system histidine kinase MtrB [Streptomyces varsoviensis]